jgi:hypothetical protein
MEAPWKPRPASRRAPLVEGYHDALRAVRCGTSRERPQYWASAVLARLERNRFRWPVRRIAFQKLAYLATVAGVPTGLEFHKGSYVSSGP